MKLSEFCIKRPVFASVLNILIVLAGLVSLSSLTIREYPKVDIPVVSVATYFPGASAEIVESQITKHLEDALSGLEGVDTLQSTSKDEHSSITLRFLPERSIEAATNDIRDRISTARELLPEDAKEPVVQKSDADSNAIIWLSTSSTDHNLMQISEYVNTVLKDNIEMLPGVARVFVVGDRTPSIKVSLDSLKLGAYNLSPQEVLSAINRQTITLPSGRVESQSLEFTLYSKTDLATLDEFENIIVKHGDQLVRLKEVAKLEYAPRSDRFSAHFNAQETVAMGIIKQSVANPLQIAEDLNKRLPAIQKHMPQGMKLELAYDSTKIIKKSIDSVYRTLAEAVFLVICVIFVFLRSARATLIPLLTIPISLIGCFTLMLALGFSINTLTLLAMVLAIGLVVDDAIVVLENIYRHIENGMKPFDASIQGIREIGFAVIAMTITLLAVFTPLAFSGGEVGKLFKEFALVLAGAVLISGITALTLSPMMCSKFLKHESNQSHNWLYWKIEKLLLKLLASYHRALDLAIRQKYKVLIGFAIILISNFFLFSTLKSEIAPAEDVGFAITIGNAPDGSGKAYTEKYAQQIEEIILKNPDIEGFFTVIGYPNVTQTMTFGLLAPHNKRSRTQYEIVNDLNAQLSSIAGLQVFAINPPSSIGGGGFGGDVSFVVQSTGGLEALSAINEKLLEKARSNPKLLNVDSNLKLNKPQFNLSINRDRAATLGVDLGDINRTIQILFGGYKAATYKQGSQQYDVMLQASLENRQTPSSLESILVRSTNGAMIPLASLVTVKETIAPSSLKHFNKLPSMTLSAALAPDYSLDEALQFLEDASYEIDPNIIIDYSGASRVFKKGANTLEKAFILALLVIFLVLAAQFESIKHPFIIMLSVPCAVVGALIVLHLAKGSLNIYSQIGLITLIGLITKHGILIVEFANQLKEQGLEATKAITEASCLRFRPILMTTLAMVLGALPLALASGAGAEGRQQIGWAIVGGMLIGTVFTLFVVPVIYSVLHPNTSTNTNHLT